MRREREGVVCQGKRGKKIIQRAHDKIDTMIHPTDDLIHPNNNIHARKRRKKGEREEGCGVAHVMRALSLSGDLSTLPFTRAPSRRGRVWWAGMSFLHASLSLSLSNTAEVKSRIGLTLPSSLFFPHDASSFKGGRGGGMEESPSMRRERVTMEEELATEAAEAGRRRCRELARILDPKSPPPPTSSSSSSSSSNSSSIQLSSAPGS